MNSGSLESFHVSWRCGWSPNARQIRMRPPIAERRAVSTSAVNQLGWEFSGAILST